MLEPESPLALSREAALAEEHRHAGRRQRRIKRSHGALRAP
jgi:hypothetical protein